MDYLLTFFKYFGLIVATFSSLIGITSDFKKEDRYGVKKVTTTGKAAILLTIMGLIISGLSIFFQDQADSQKAMAIILRENKKQFEELKRFQIQVNSLNEIRYKEASLIKKQDSLRFIQDSLSNRQENEQIKFQIKNNSYLLKQTLVDNYLQSTPEKVEFLIEVQNPAKLVSINYDKSRLSMYWFSRDPLTPNNVNRFFVGGYIAQQNGSLFLYTHNEDKISGVGEELTEDVAFNQDTTFVGKTQLVPIIKKSPNSAYLVIDLTYFHYTNAPWHRIIDFRRNDYQVVLLRKMPGGYEFFNPAYQHPKSELIDCYLRFDCKYILKLSNRQYTIDSEDEYSNNWKNFRESIISNRSH